MCAGTVSFNKEILRCIIINLTHKSFMALRLIGNKPLDNNYLLEVVLFYQMQLENGSQALFKRLQCNKVGNKLKYSAFSGYINH